MKDRIREVMEYARLSQQEFAARLEISPASLSSIFTGRTNPTNNHVRAIHRAFPEINVNWIMFGEGQMLCSEGENSDQRSGADDSIAASVKPLSVSEADAVAVGISPERTLFNQNFIDNSNPVASEIHPSVPVRKDSPVSRYSAMPANLGINADKRTRKIKEIRVFFDDGTYESFVPSK